jgi:tripartite-type tricarboxylate transporter receptor subunit TctC
MLKGRFRRVLYKLDKAPIKELRISRPILGTDAGESEVMDHVLAARQEPPMRRRHFNTSLITATLGLHTPMRALAQASSTERITLYVPFPAGGGADALARRVALPLASATGQTVVVENIPGASGSLAAQRMLSSAADGNAIMVVSSSETIMPPLLLSGVRYQAEDFRLVSGPLHAPVALLARPGLPPNNLKELLAYSRNPANPRLSYGSLGPGTIAHLAAEHFSRLTAMELLHVPYRGGAPLFTDFLADRIDLSFLPLAGPSLQLADTGRLKVYGIASAERLPHLARYELLPDHPSLKTFVHSAWNAFAVSKAVPVPVAEHLNQVLNEVLRSPDIRSFAEGLGSQAPPATTLAEADDFYQHEISTTRALARAMNLKAQ